MATLQEITDRFRAAVAGGSIPGKTVKIDMKGDGFVFIDGATVTNEDAEADCTLVVSKDDLEDMAGGRLDPIAAFSQGKLRVLGDMGVAMQLQGLFARARG
jgi:putative sterol carrier protein